MKKTKMIIMIAVIAIIVAIAGLLGYVKLALPNVGNPEDIKVELNAERINNGMYLANSLYVCMDCHSTRDWSKFSGPIVENTLGKGGEVFNQDMGFPGEYYAKNITPQALQSWTDGEILRAITSGVNKQGKALFPVMPYLNYGQLDREEIYSVIAYLRTLPSIANDVPESKSDFPMNFIINMMPQKAKYSNIPDKTNKVVYGKYLTTAASCTDCHTQQENGKPLDGMEFAGGFKFQLMTGGIVNSANITPDMETGIGSWTEEAFTYRFKLYADSTYQPTAINKGDFNTVMPWIMYSTMKLEELKAIYAYLKTVKPVSNKVTKFMTVK